MRLWSLGLIPIYGLIYLYFYIIKFFVFIIRYNSITVGGRLKVNRNTFKGPMHTFKGPTHSEEKAVYTPYTTF